MRVKAVYENARRSVMLATCATSMVLVVAAGPVWAVAPMVDGTATACHNDGECYRKTQMDTTAPYVASCAAGAGVAFWAPIEGCASGAILQGLHDAGIDPPYDW